MSRITQTELSEEFGLSSIAMGKKLVELKLKDKNTKLATDYAIKHRLGKNITYIKGRKEVKMAIWNEGTIKYVKHQLFKNKSFCAQTLIAKLKKIKQVSDKYDGSKAEQLEFDFLYDSFQQTLQLFEGDMKVLRLFFDELKKENILEYAQKFDELKDLTILVNKYELENELDVKSLQRKISKI